MSRNMLSVSTMSMNTRSISTLCLKHCVEVAQGIQGGFMGGSETKRQSPIRGINEGDGTVGGTVIIQVMSMMRIVVCDLVFDGVDGMLSLWEVYRGVFCNLSCCCVLDRRH